MNYYGAKQMAAGWRTVRKNTIQVAAEIPEAQYNFRATPETMSVAEMLTHLATSPHWAMQLHFLDKKSAVSGEDFGRYMGEAKQLAATLTSKDAIIASLTTNGEAMAMQIEQMTDEQLAEPVAVMATDKSRFELLLGLKEHEMHHRAQLMQMQRLLGMVPHLTRARQHAS